MQAAIGFVGSDMADFTLAIGMDTAQGRPGDPLEYTAGAGGAAFLLGPAEMSLATIEGSYSYATDTPDFFRRAEEKYPVHGERFTGEPAYFRHTTSAAQALMEAMDCSPADFQHVIFHQPNTKFPKRVAKLLGFTAEQIEIGLLVPKIGNVYAGSALIGLTAVLDGAEPDQRILLVSYGSGAGSDAMVLQTTALLPVRRELAPKTADYIARRTEIDYATYARYHGKIAMK
jgi:hydroxymethylglutaryl-CoA synthase